MKRVIAIGVVFALVAGAAFAAVSVGVDFEATVNFLEGDSGVLPDGVDSDGNPKYRNDEVVYAHGWIGASHFTASYTSEDGTVGGLVRILRDGTSNRAFAWWKPIEQFKLYLGIDGDGQFGIGNISGWSFTEGALSGIGFHYNYNAFPGAFNNGLGMVITPISGLDFYIGVPFLDFGNQERAENVFKKTWAQVKYDINGIGTVGLAIQGDLTTKNKVNAGTATDNDWGYNLGSSSAYYKFQNDNPDLRLIFKLTAVQNLMVELGIGYKIAYTYKDETDVAGTKTSLDLTKNNPLRIGLDAQYDMGAFGVKLRSQMDLGAGAKGVYTSKTSGNSSLDTDLTVDVQDPFGLMLEVMPYYAVTDQIKILLNVGVWYHGFRTTKYSGKVSGTDVHDDAYGDTFKEVKVVDHVQFFINPYSVIQCGNGMSFHVGFWLKAFTNEGSPDHGRVAKDGKFVSWAIPIGLKIGF